MSEKKSEENVDVNIDREKVEIIESISDRSSYQENFDEKISNSDLSRRNFLKALGLVGGGVVAGSVAMSGSKILSVEELVENKDKQVEGSMNSATGRATQSSTSGGDSTGSAYTAQEHTIELEADGDQPVNYYFKVAETVVESSGTSNN